MAGLVSNKIREITYRKNTRKMFAYMRIENGAMMYNSYTDCRDKINPITDRQDLENLIPKLKDFLTLRIEASTTQDDSKKKIGLMQLLVIFENIYETNCL